VFECYERSSGLISKFPAYFDKGFPVHRKDKRISDDRIGVYELKAKSSVIGHHAAIAFNRIFGRKRVERVDFR